MFRREVLSVHQGRKFAQLILTNGRWRCESPTHFRRLFSIIYAPLKLWITSRIFTQDATLAFNRGMCTTAAVSHVAAHFRQRKCACTALKRLCRHSSQGEPPRHTIHYAQCGVSKGRPSPPDITRGIIIPFSLILRIFRTLGLTALCCATGDGTGQIVTEVKSVGLGTWVGK